MSIEFGNNFNEFCKNLRYLQSKLEEEGIIEDGRINYNVLTKEIKKIAPFKTVEIEYYIQKLMDIDKKNISMYEKDGEKIVVFRSGFKIGEKTSIKVDGEVQRRLNQVKYRYNLKNVNEIILDSLDLYEYVRDKNYHIYQTLENEKTIKDEKEKNEWAFHKLQIEICKMSKEELIDLYCEIYGEELFLNYGDINISESNNQQYKELLNKINNIEKKLHELSRENLEQYLLDKIAKGFPFTPIEYLEIFENKRLEGKND